MAKTKQTKKVSRKSTNPQRTKVRVNRNARALDIRAADYARLLHDPCGAPLCHPVYAGGESGFLFRADSVASFGGASLETSGIVHWTPGYVNSSNTDLLAMSGANSGSSLTMAGNAGGPARTFLTNNAFGVRCVAACVKVSYPGAESARAGRLHYGHTQAGTIDAGDIVTVDSVAPLVQHYTRTPPEIVEIVWRPGFADQEFNDPNAAASAALRDRKSSITVAWAGLPAAVGMTFHFTAIYEWTPKPGAGVATNTTGKNSSQNSLDHVIDFLQDRGFTWVRNAAHAMGSGAARGAMSAISNSFGIMPALSTSRLGLTGF